MFSQYLFIKPGFKITNSQEYRVCLPIIKANYIQPRRWTENNQMHGITTWHFLIIWCKDYLWLFFCIIRAKVGAAVTVCAHLLIFSAIPWTGMYLHDNMVWCGWLPFLTFGEPCELPFLLLQSACHMKKKRKKKKVLAVMPGVGVIWRI